MGALLRNRGIMSEHATGALYELCSNPVAAGLFLHPVEKQHPELIEVYRKTIKRPLDLGTVARRLRAGKYEAEPERCLRRVRRVFKNCEKFNLDSPRYREIARHLRGYFDELWRLFVKWPSELRSALSAVRGDKLRERDHWLQAFVAFGEDIPLSYSEVVRAAHLPQLARGIKHGSTLRDLLKQAGGEPEHPEVNALLAVLSIRCAERRTRGSDVSYTWCSTTKLSHTKVANTFWPVLVLSPLEFNVNRLPSEVQSSLARDRARLNTVNSVELVEYLGTHEVAWLCSDALEREHRKIEARSRPLKRKQDRELLDLARDEAAKAMLAQNALYATGENDKDVADQADNLLKSERTDLHGEEAYLSSSSESTDGISTEETCESRRPLQSHDHNKKISHVAFPFTSSHTAQRAPVGPMLSPGHGIGSGEYLHKKRARVSPQCTLLQANVTHEIDTEAYAQGNAESLLSSTVAAPCVTAKPAKKQVVSKPPKQIGLMKAATKERVRPYRAAKRELMSQCPHKSFVDRRKTASAKATRYAAILLQGRPITIGFDGHWARLRAKHNVPSSRWRSPTRQQVNETLSDKQRSPHNESLLRSESSDMSMHCNFRDNDRSEVFRTYVEREVIRRPRVSETTSTTYFSGVGILDSSNSSRTHLLFSILDCDMGSFESSMNLTFGELMRCYRLVRRALARVEATLAARNAASDNTDSEAESCSRLPPTCGLTCRERAQDLLLMRMRLHYEVLYLEQLDYSD
eukprot:CAMPEP_0198653280 /NCGR_PEP_ID=MMETSP1467-20131203/6942_1 /TAXON_ID=1462469 /ORGANISM="unid. sp., Strain CCMP2135" /LENGTH=747 /DNA_ID=CAMNT_0044389237 /DNA_START=138 /DNA_END=2381 /DNA_ORIENTATION=+